MMKKKNFKIGNSVKMAIKMASKFPIYQCWEAEEIFKKHNGMGSVIITRKGSQDNIIMSVFLLDACCLGVKNTFIVGLNEKDYQYRLETIRANETLREITPSRARKLVEGAEEYAEGLGFSPHRDYFTAKRIFGDIDTETCSDVFEYGRDGKPMYIAGPHDSQYFINNVINTLTKKLGPDGFHYIVSLDQPF